jgi:hypothetical protein
MVTYLEDTNLFQFWNGSAWANLVSSSAGLEHIITSSFTGVTSASFGSDASPVFSSTYDNYRILVRSLSSTNADRNWALRMRANTSDDSSAVYGRANQGIDSQAGTQNNTGGGQTSAIILPNGHYGSFNPYVVSFDLMGPFLASDTYGLGTTSGQLSSGATIHQSFTFVNDSNTSFNGFTFFNSSGNFVDGVVSVYGYRKA